MKNRLFSNISDNPKISQEAQASQEDNFSIFHLQPWRQIRWWVPLLYLAITLLMTWPLVLHFTDGVIRGAPDHYQNIWNFWWVRTTLFEQHHNPYYTDLLFYPFRTAPDSLPLYYHTLTPALMLPGGLLSYVLGYAVTFNLIVVLAFVLSGWAAFSLANYFLKNVPAAFVAGGAYTFCNYHFHNLLQGQLSVLWWVWLPLYLLFLHRSLKLEANPPPQTFWKKWQNPLLAALFLILATLTDWYSLLYLLLYTGIFGLYLLITQFRQTPVIIIRLAVIGLIWLIPVAPLLVATLRAGDDSSLRLVEGSDVEILQSSSVQELFQPNQPGQFAWVFLGYVALLLAGLGVWWGWRKGALCWAAVFLVATVMTFGPYLQVTPVDQSGVSTLKNGWPMPYWLLDKLPLVNIGRSPVRFNMLGRLGLALLVGWGIVALISLSQKYLKMSKGLANRALPAVALVLMMFEAQALPLTIEILPEPAFFKQIAAEPSEFAILELPITNHFVEDNRRMYFQALHHHPIAGGYISRETIDYYRVNGSLFGTYFDSIHPTNDNGLTEQAKAPLDLLSAYNFRYVINYKDEYPTSNPDGFANTEHFLEQLMGKSARIYEDQWMTAWRVPAERPAVTLTATPGFYPVEKRPDGQQFRWADAEAGLKLVAPQNPTQVQLGFTAWSIRPEDKLEVSYGGQTVAIFQLYGVPQTFSLPPLKLAPGDNTITFHTVAPARSPQEDNPASTDQRHLAFALSQFTIFYTKS